MSARSGSWSIFPLSRRSGAAAHGLLRLALGAIVAAIVLIAAYQVRPTYDLAIGDTPQDTPLVRDFNAPERQPVADGGRRFRWTRAASEIVLPGIGKGARTLDLVLSSGGNPNPDLRLLANGVPVAVVPLTPDFRPYRVAIPAEVMARGSLTLGFEAVPYTPRGDRRTLGVVVQSVTVRPDGGGFALPPARITATLWAAAVSVALALLVAGFGGWGAALGAAGAAGGMAAFLVENRLFLTVDAGGVARGAILMLAVAAAVRFGAPPVCRRLGLATTARDVRWLALIAGAALALRLAGELHPGITIVDLRFHLNRFADVVDRRTLLLPIQSAEFGGRTVLYAPTPYLFMIPLSWVIRDRALMLILFSLFVDGLRFCVLWYVARRVTRDRRAANLAVATMAVVPVGWIVYSWGTFANIFAEGMLTLLFALLALDFHRLAGAHRWRWCAVFAGVIAVTLLAHIGVFVLTAATVALYGVARLTPLPPARNGKGERMRAVALYGVASVLAAVVAFALFYRFPAQDALAGRQAAAVEQEGTAVATPAARMYRTGGATPDARIGLDAVSTPNLVEALAREAWEMTFAFYRVWPVLASVVGIALTPRATRTRAPGSPQGRDEGRTQIRAPDDAALVGDDGATVRWGAAVTMAVWLVVAAVMLVVGIMARLYVRYPLYALPAVALGAGIALARVARRWRWGWVVVALLLGYSAVTTLLMWYDRIVYAFKVIV